jgi:hypothetical protein
LPPQPVQQPGCADRPGVDDLQGRRAGGQAGVRGVADAVTLAEVSVDRRGQPAQPVEVEAVDAAQVHQHVRLGLPVDPPVMGQSHVAHHRAVGVGPLREPQIHDHDQTTTCLIRQDTTSQSCYHTFMPGRRLRPARNPLTSTHP